MFSGKEHIVEDDEAEKVADRFNSEKFIELRNGEIINPKGIEGIGKPSLLPYWHGYLLNSDGRSFQRDGVRIYLETENFLEIEYKTNPKYFALEKFKMLK